MADGTYLDGYHTGWMSILPQVPIPIAPLPPEGRFASYEEGFYQGQDDALAWGRPEGPAAPA